MKKISKKKLDKLIAMTREYWHGEYEQERNRAILSKRITMAEALEKEIGLHWGAVLGLLDGILQNHGFFRDATNDEIYCALRCLGWEVTDAEDEESEGL
jgi:hypothetical protein